MILSDLLGKEVVDDAGRRLGALVDARFAVDGEPHQLLADARLVGFVVSPRTRGSYLGYERNAIRGPWPLAHLLRRRHRGSFLVPWEDVALVESERITLRAGYARLPVSLPTRGAARRT